MLRIIQNSGGAKRYFSTADYYSEGQELRGTWHGKGAALLGLGGEIKQTEWDALCDNQDPRTGKRLTLRTNANRTVGYDFNFHVPKGVSLRYAETRDDRVLDAFRDAVDATMRDIEAEAKTRVRKNGADQDRFTGNLVWGTYIHFTARPVDGVPDPHLHGHCFVFNTTWDSSETAWKAGQFRELKRDAPYFEAIYHARLARNLAQLGLPLTRTAKGWDLAGLSDELLKAFSRRTTEIEKEAEAKGIEDPDEKAELGAKTRDRKAKDLTFPQLQAEWRSRMSSEELASIAALAARVGGEETAWDSANAQRSVDYAVNHEFERASVVPERRLLATALKRAVGEASPEEVLRAYHRAELIRGDRDGRTMVTMRHVLNEEREVIAFAKEGRGQCRPLVAGDFAIKRDWLNQAQRQAVRHILQSRDRVTLVRGAAGVGKTSLMQEAVEAIEAGGTKVFAFAPSAAASRGVQREGGFAGADTVARLLLDQSVHERARGQLLWIDEAGLLGMRALRDLFRLADRIDARVLLTGDPKQHGSVSRGAVLKLLEDEAGVRPAEVREIQRQAGEYKQAVRALSEGRVGDGFKALDQLGWIRKAPDGERYALLAADYARARREGKTALIVSPTHFEGRMIDHELRRLLKTQGTLKGGEREFPTLANAQMTDAQKQDAANYQRGDVIQFFQNARGFAKGQRLVVGKSRLPLDRSDRFTLFRSGTLRLAPGEVIRITHNGRTADGKHRLDNGAIFTVKSFDAGGNIVLKNGWTVAKDFGHLAYGYTVTSHASQSRTVDCILVGQSSRSAMAASREQFYVSCSRGRHQATIYTDDKAALLDAVSQSDERLTATEFIGWEQVRRRLRESQLADVARDERSIEPQRELAHGR